MSRSVLYYHRVSVAYARIELDSFVSENFVYSLDKNRRFFVCDVAGTVVFYNKVFVLAFTFESYYIASEWRGGARFRLWRVP